MSSARTKPTQTYVTQVAHRHGVKLSQGAREAYAELPDREAVQDMVSHASKLAKSVGRKTISTRMATVEMRHYRDNAKKH